MGKERSCRDGLQTRVAARRGTSRRTAGQSERAPTLGREGRSVCVVKTRQTGSEEGASDDKAETGEGDSDGDGDGRKVGGKVGWKV